MMNVKIILFTALFYGQKASADVAPPRGKHLPNVTLDDGYLERSAVTTRKIGMYFQLELYRAKQLNQPILEKITVFDAKLRQCYTQSLRESASLRGTIVFRLLISERTGFVQQIRRHGGSIVHDGLTDCLVREIKQIPLQVEKNLIGELKVTLDVS